LLPLDETLRTSQMPINGLSYSFDFDNAIAAHKVWLRHLEFFIDGLEPDFVNLDTAGDCTLCNLGQWLQGSGRERYGSLPVFGPLVAVHRRFHETAGVVVAHIHQHRLEEADALLKGELSDLSAEIVRQLEALKQAYHIENRRPAA
jgi:hypothetical protein